MSTGILPIWYPYLWFQSTDFAGTTNKGTLASPQGLKLKPQLIDCGIPTNSQVIMQDQRPRAAP